MTGTVTQIKPLPQRGNICGEDGKLRQFRRVDMVLYLQFRKLQAGTVVRFDVDDTSGRAINVERV